MGRASSRKRERRAERAADARRLRIVVCTNVDQSLAPAAELLKAAIIYGDEVLLHSPTALLLASVASLSDSSADDLVTLIREVAPAMGEDGVALAEQMCSLEKTYGTEGTQNIIRLLLDGESGMQQLITTLDPATGAELAESARCFASVRQDLNRVVEEQLSTAGVASVMPAVEAGLLQLVPINQTADLFEGYIEALWTVLRDPKYYPLFDTGIAQLVDAAVREGVVDLSTGSRSRGRQASAASGFLARLPTFPLASMDEIVDIRGELDRPLVRFRAEMVCVSRDLGVDAHDPDFEEAAEEAWISKVNPALLELEELVEEKRLSAQFGAKLPHSGLSAAVSGLVAGIITHAPVVSLGVAATASMATTAA